MAGGQQQAVRNHERSHVFYAQSPRERPRVKASASPWPIGARCMRLFTRVFHFLSRVADFIHPSWTAFSISYASGAPISFPLSMHSTFTKGGITTVPYRSLSSCSLNTSRCGTQAFRRAPQQSGDERAAVEDGVRAFDRLVAKLVDVPTPAGLPLRQLGSGSGPPLTSDAPGGGVGHR